MVHQFIEQQRQALLHAQPSYPGSSSRNSAAAAANSYISNGLGNEIVTVIVSNDGQQQQIGVGAAQMDDSMSVISRIPHQAIPTIHHRPLNIAESETVHAEVMQVSVLNAVGTEGDEDGSTPVYTEAFLADEVVFSVG